MLKESANRLPWDYQYNGIDIIKFICAFLVCIIHIQLFDLEAIDNNLLSYLNFGLKHCLCRIAVPFYFTASGFFLFRKMDFHSLNEDRIKGYCFKILRILGTWTFLLFVGPCYQLWYLGALVLAVLILSFFIKRGIALRYIIIISIILYMIGLLGESYYGFIEPLKNYSIPKQIIEGYENVFSTTRNGVFFGFIFVLLGALFAQKRIVLNNIVAYLGLIVSLTALCMEAYFLKIYSHTKGYNMYISLLPVVFFLFYLATHAHLKNRPIYGSLRIIGMLVFFTHLFFDYFVRLGIETLKDKTGINISIFQFIITIFFTMMFAILIERLSKTKKLQWLKFLYS